MKVGTKVVEAMYPTSVLTVIGTTSDGWTLAKYGDGFTLSFAPGQLRAV